MLNKPAGLPSHPGPRGGPSAEDWFPVLSRRPDGPWLAHRLDTDTAGCLLVALRKTALLEAQRCFGDRTVEKRYWAVVAGDPPDAAGRIEQPLGKRSDRTGWRMVADPASGPAITEWRRLGAGTAGGRRISWLELRLLTGRTHQARAHCAALGCPILGDPIYGGDGGGSDRAGLHLLARALFLPLDPPVAAEAPPPPHMRAALGHCGHAPPPASPGRVAPARGGP